MLNPMNNEMENNMRTNQSHVHTFNDQSSLLLNANPHATSDTPLSSEQLRDKLRKQLEYYFSKENIINDIYLQSQMDADNYVPISMIGNFKLVKRLTHDLQLIIDVLKESPLMEVDSEEKKVRSSDSKIHLPTRKRCIIILRNVPLDATDNEILGLFINDSCPVAAIGCERVLESDHSDCWYVTFHSEDDAQNAFLYLTRENISIRDQKILARMKACLWQKPPIPSNESLAKPSPSSKSSIQEYYTPIYLPSAAPPTNHITPAPFLRNLSQQPTINYHPTQILQQQQRQHVPLNYNVNMLPHQPTIPTALPFATNNPHQVNMNFYPPTHYINRNHPVFPTNFWYIPSAIDSYSSMTYNGIHKPKTRLTAPKSRKPVSHHDGANAANSNLANSSQNQNASSAEESHSTVPSSETSSNVPTSTSSSGETNNENHFDQVLNGNDQYQKE
ncbi:unnamed protein product [Adineta ricciae]|uniref:HTH La-type RNA-binding domain-containing protein n=1 Tax=Adineta ricciae TaxID=249248 RepID=A0A814J8I1_ADIRI|nr:unnamed protein product [Adineta ricciae]CAF1100742.1 unnamed protein product [Adineta ricciae]